MVKSPMLMDWQTRHCENGHSAKINVHVQCNPYQNQNDIIHRDGKLNPKIHMEIQMTSDSQSNSEQNSNAGGITIPNF
jgi:hypothetical protein